MTVSSEARFYLLEASKDIQHLLTLLDMRATDTQRESLIRLLQITAHHVQFNLSMFHEEIEDTEEIEAA